MSKTGKKASVAAIAYAQQIIDSGLTDEISEKYKGQKLGKSTSWETCFEIIPIGYQVNVGTCTKSDTKIEITKDSEVVETLRLPSSAVWIPGEMDWDWNYLYKYICEWFIKNSKKIGKKKKTKKSSPTDVKTLMKEVAELREQIKTAKSSQKKKLVKEYDTKSKLLESLLETESQKNIKKQLDADKLAELRSKKRSLATKIGFAKKNGEDITELSAQLKEVTSILNKYGK